MNVSLTPAQEKQVMADATHLLVERLIHTTHGSLLSKAQAAGILDVEQKTLMSLGIPRVVMSNKVVRYRMTDIQAFISSKIEK